MGLLTIILQLALLGVTAAIGFILYIQYKHRQYFKKLEIPYMGAGTSRFFHILTGKISLHELELEMYQEAKGIDKKIIGYSDAFVNPGVCITDLDLAKNVYVKDFDHFVNRRKFTTAKGDVLFHKMIVSLEDEAWKGMRNKLSPTFTTGKIRRMFEIFNKSSARMSAYLAERVGSNKGIIDISDVYSKYAMDVIASCVFGIDSKSFDYEPGKFSKFEEMGQRLQFKFKIGMLLKFIVIMGAPKVAEFFGLEISDLTPQRYFQQVINQVLKHRRETGERQEDFLQLMMDIQKGLLKDTNSKEVLEVMTGGEEGEGKTWGEEQSKKISFDDDYLAANSVLFLLAGFDTLQSVLIMSAYCLAIEQDMQKKVLAEIKESMAANGGKLTYDGIHEMKFLDMFINETLRFYPPAPRTERMCTKDYPIPGTNSVIEKGVVVSLPVLGIHRDPEHFENPEKFDPERFLPERKSERHPYAFQPFGHGPRNCIGMRFALTEVKSAICHLVNDFHLEPCGKTVIPPKFDNNSSLKPLNGMWLGIRPRSEK